MRTRPAVPLLMTHLERVVNASGVIMPHNMLGREIIHEAERGPLQTLGCSRETKCLGGASIVSRKIDVQTIA